MVYGFVGESVWGWGRVGVLLVSGLVCLCSFLFVDFC